MHSGIGVIRYYESELKINVAIDDELARYYRSLIPKYIKVNPQKYPTHITLVRNEEVPNMDYWGKYEGLEVKFLYSPLRSGSVYWWLDAYSDFFCELRIELGLEPHNDLTKPPDKKSCFHITIGNMKK